MEKLLSIEDVATIFQIKISTIYNWVHRKKIKYVKIGRLVRFRFEDVQDYINLHTHEKQYVGV